MKLEWSVFALSDRDGIFDYLEADSPRSVIRVDEAIANAAERLIDFSRKWATWPYHRNA